MAIDTYETTTIITERPCPGIAAMRALLHRLCGQGYYSVEDRDAMLAECQATRCDECQAKDSSGPGSPSAPSAEAWPGDPWPTDFPAEVVAADIESLAAELCRNDLPLCRFGITMTEAELEGFALEIGHGKTLGQMSEDEKTAFRYRYIMAKARVLPDATDTTGGQVGYQVAYQTGGRGVCHRTIAGAVRDLRAVVNEAAITGETQPIRIVAVDFPVAGSNAWGRERELTEAERAEVGRLVIRDRQKSIAHKWRRNGPKDDRGR